VVGVIVIIGTVGGMAYIVLRKRRFQKIPPPPPRALAKCIPASFKVKTL
jgi:hypothetical protein